MKLSNQKFFLTIVLFCFWSGIFAQNIKIFFPAFVGEKYVFILNEGLKMDTVQSGIVEKSGVVNLTVPGKYKPYSGIGYWSIIKGGRINFVVNNEDLSITCKDSIPTSQNIIYQGNKENDLLKKYETDISIFYQKMDSIFRAEKIANHPDSFPPSFLKAMQMMNDYYSVIQKRLAVDSSYAAFYWRSFNYLKGLGNRIYYKKTDANAYFDDFTHYVTYELDFKRLYFSGLWSSIISSTFSSPDKTVWAENMVTALKRTESQRIFEALATDLVVISEQYGWDDAKEIILASLELSGRLPDDPSNIVNRAIRQSKIKLGDKAPALIGLEGKLTNTLLIFYESGCSLCQHQLSEITDRYSKLVEKGIRVVSVSIDEDRNVFEFHSKDFPWPDRLCDFKGLKGDNISNYGVVGTPAIYFINENGIIQDKQTRLDDIKGLNLR